MSGGQMRRAGADRVTAVTRMAANLMRSEGGPEVAVIEATGWTRMPIRAAARVLWRSAWRPWIKR
jgi:hypothetical protein